MDKLSLDCFQPAEPRKLAGNLLCLTQSMQTVHRNEWRTTNLLRLYYFFKNAFLSSPSRVLWTSKEPGNLFIRCGLMESAVRLLAQ